ncbi:MAG: SRPBCC family protein [Bacteroidales bacterium]|nr:SRPBCC family protein [Bacteroidales bacterium]
MKALKIIIGIIVVIAAIILIGALFMPKHVKVEQSLVMKAGPEVIFKQVNCFKNWDPWNPWLDSLMVQSYSGPECGQGAVYSWSHEKMGNGKQTIVEIKENEMIKAELVFEGMDPVLSLWYFDKTEEGTKVTWTYETDLGYPVWRWIGNLFMKPQIEKFYKKGLIALNEYTKDMKPEPVWKTGPVEEKMLVPQLALSIKSTVTMENMPQKMDELFGKITETIEKYKMEMAGSAFSLWHEWNPEGESIMECGIPVKKAGKLTGEAKMIRTYGGKAVMAIHYGTYETSDQTWYALDNYLKEKSYKMAGAPWEVYVVGPNTEPDPAKWVTEIYYPVK